MVSTLYLGHASSWFLRKPHGSQRGKLLRNSETKWPERLCTAGVLAPSGLFSGSFFFVFI